MSIYYEPGTEGLTDPRPAEDERDAIITALQAALESFAKSMNELKRERDEARDIAEKLSMQGLNTMDENRSLKRERDEAREVADRCRVALHDTIERPKGVVPQSAERFYKTSFPWEAAK